MAKLCSYKSADSCGYLENRLSPCTDCPFGPKKEAREAGEAGQEGKIGPPGPSIEGPRGEKGDTVRGDKGEKGDTVLGPTGLTGVDGRDGRPGTSIKGEKGEKGEPGEDIDREELIELIKKYSTSKPPDLLLGWGARAKHGNLPDVTASQHHVKYTNAEAVTAAKTVKLDDFATPDDNADLNATTSKHGLLKKLGGGTSNFLRADGSWAAPSGSVTRETHITLANSVSGIAFSN